MAKELRRLLALMVLQYTGKIATYWHIHYHLDLHIAQGYGSFYFYFLDSINYLLSVNLYVYLKNVF